MGNFSVNHYSRIEVLTDRISIRYIIDFAEIPAFQEMQQAGITAQDSEQAHTRFAAQRGGQLAGGLSLVVDGQRLPLRVISSEVLFPPGAGGLPTLKMGFDFEGSLPQGIDRSHINLQFTDNNYAGHSGWKEIVATARAGALLHSSAPSADRSAELNNYPTDLLNSPPQNLEASIDFSLPPVPTVAPRASALVTTRQRTAGDVTSPLQTYIAPVRPRMTPSMPAMVQKAATTSLVARPPVTLAANRQQTPRSRFTELIATQRLSGWFLFTAILIAIGLGALHALEPGHGKTIVAAYLVGSRGTASHALLLGLIVTVSHTAGVFALGAVTLYASRYIVPEQLYPWLSVLSGLTIAALGIYMLLRRLTGTATDHSHAPGSVQAHWPFAKRLTQADPAAREDVHQNRGVSLTQLFTLGITGGIIPCPAALVVLLSAFALHRVALGFLLIIAFSLGLAAVLIAFGMLMVYAGRLVAKLRIDGPLTRRWLPAASAAFISALGLALAAQALSTLHLSVFSFSREKLGPFLFVVGLGILLGMRHSTDADHVVAISTIVTRQRGMRSAALIGSVWGLGHTITVFAVGAFIILLGVRIPPRIGLSMEFCVALMLVLLGVLNLTGIMARITNRLSIAGTRNSLDSSTRSRNASREPALAAIRSLGAFQLLRPLVIGLVHGLAGSAAVALLVLSTIRDPIWATVYLLVFGGGTMLGMMLMTTAISLPLSFAGVRSARLSRWFGVASGMASLCFGSFLVYQLGFLGGLFTAHPHWIPQ